MNLRTRSLALLPSLLAATCMSSYAGVTLSIDSATQQNSTDWTLSPAYTLGNQSIAAPSFQNSQDGGVSSGVLFKAGSSFNLGAVEIDEAFATGTPNFNLVMYDLGASYTLPSSSPVYTFTGTELNLFTPLNVTLTSARQFDVFTFSGADNISITSGHSYWFGLVATDGTSSLTWERGPITPNQDIAVNSSTAVGGAGTTLNNGGTGANRTPIAAFFAVPEPSSFALAGLGMAALVAFRRRKA